MAAQPSRTALRRSGSRSTMTSIGFGSVRGLDPLFRRTPDGIGRERLRVVSPAAGSLSRPTPLRGQSRRPLALSPFPGRASSPRAVPLPGLNRL